MMKCTVVYNKNNILEIKDMNNQIFRENSMDESLLNDSSLVLYAISFYGNHKNYICCLAAFTTLTTLVLFGEYPYFLLMYIYARLN